MHYYNMWITIKDIPFNVDVKNTIYPIETLITVKDDCFLPVDGEFSKNNNQEFLVFSNNHVLHSPIESLIEYSNKNNITISYPEIDDLSLNYLIKSIPINAYPAVSSYLNSLGVDFYTIKNLIEEDYNEHYLMKYLFRNIDGMNSYIAEQDLPFSLMEVIQNYIKNTPENPIFIINQDLNSDIITSLSIIIGSLSAYAKQIQRKCIGVYNPSNIFDKKTFADFLTLNQDGILNICLLCNWYSKEEVIKYLQEALEIMSQRDSNPIIIFTLPRYMNEYIYANRILFQDYEMIHIEEKELSKEKALEYLLQEAKDEEYTDFSYICYLEQEFESYKGKLFLRNLREFFNNWKGKLLREKIYTQYKDL